MLRQFSNRFGLYALWIYRFLRKRWEFWWRYKFNYLCFDWLWSSWWAWTGFLFFFLPRSFRSASNDCLDHFGDHFCLVNFLETVQEWWGYHRPGSCYNRSKDWLLSSHHIIVVNRCTKLKYHMANQDNMRSYKATEGHRRPPKATEGHRRPPKGIQDHTRPY